MLIEGKKRTVVSTYLVTKYQFKNQMCHNNLFAIKGSENLN